MNFFIMYDLTIHSLTCYCGWTMQNFLFFQFGLQTFFFQWFIPNQKSIDFDFLYKKWLKEKGPKWKGR